MVKCQWSENNLCQVFVVLGSVTKISCDGLKDRSCEGKAGNIEDIRDRQRREIALEKTAIAVATGQRIRPGRGGRRTGAGAPRGNLNALKSGAFSLQLKRAYLEEGRILKKAKESRASQTEKRQVNEER